MFWFISKTVTDEALTWWRSTLAGGPPPEERTRENDVPTGKVKWFDAEKGFGFVTGDDGQEVYLHTSVLPPEVGSVKAGTRLEYGIADGRRGKQALSARVLGEQPSVARAARKPAAEMGELVQDLVNMLDNTTGQLRNGHYPKPEQSKKIAALLRRVAEDFDA